MFNKAVFACLFLFSSHAFAGLFNDVPVQIFYTNNDPNDTHVAAYGSFNSARYSANDVEQIGCGVRRASEEAGQPSFGFCQATNAEGASYSCGTFDLELMDALSAASNNSFVLFFARPFDPANPDEIGFLQDRRGFQQYCTVVQVSTQSMYIFDAKAAEKSSKK